jgi:glucose/arabinose dehydrogenase
MQSMLAHGPRRRTSRTFAAILTAALLIGMYPVDPVGAGAATRAISLRAIPVATGLVQPAGFALSPKGLIWYLEKTTGELRILNPVTGHDRSFTTIPKVDGEGERGALGIAFHPRYPSAPFVYVFATRRVNGRPWNQLLRIRVDGGKPAGLRVLLRSPVDASTNHNGGHLAFGPDRKLYVMIGDGGGEYPKDPAHAQRLGDLRGKILRLDPDGTAARRNPFGTRVWSFGHRNSFGFAFDPQTRRLWETENGPQCNDEINLIARGSNFAWGPHQACGSLRAPVDTNRDGPTPRHLPKHWWARTIGVTGAAFCDRCGLGLNGRMLVGDVNTGSIRAVTLNAARSDVSTVRTVLQAGIPVYSLQTDRRGRIFFSGPTGIWRLATRTRGS